MQRKELGSDPGFGASPAPARPMTNLVEEVEATQTERRPVPVARPRSRAKYVVMLVLVIAVAAGATAYMHLQNRVSTDDATVDGHISAVAPKISGNVVDV